MSNDDESEIDAELDGEVGDEGIADAGLQEKKTGPIWCVVANVEKETEYGEQKEIKSGVKHFPGGAKVYCFPPLWGDGYERVQVIGRHRGSHQFVTMIVPAKHLTNWRAKLVYSPYITEQLKDHWDGSEKSKQRATKLADWKNTGVFQQSQQAESAPPTLFQSIIQFFKTFMKKVNR